MKSFRNLTSHQKAWAKSEIRKGTAVSEIAKSLGVAAKSISNFKYRTNIKEEAIQREYEEGASAPSLAKKFNISISTVRRMVQPRNWYNDIKVGDTKLTKSLVESTRKEMPSPSGIRSTGAAVASLIQLEQFDKLDKTDKATIVENLQREVNRRIKEIKKAVKKKDKLMYEPASVLTYERLSSTRDIDKQYEAAKRFLTEYKTATVESESKRQAAEFEKITHDMEVDESSWTGKQRAAFFEKYRKVMSDPTMTYYLRSYGEYGSAYYYGSDLIMNYLYEEYYNQQYTSDFNVAMDKIEQLAKDAMEYELEQKNKILSQSTPALKIRQSDVRRISEELGYGDDYLPFV